MRPLCMIPSWRLECGVLPEDDGSHGKLHKYPAPHLVDLRRLLTKPIQPTKSHQTPPYSINHVLCPRPKIQANCRIICGDADYDLDVETDDWVTYSCIVKKDFGSHFGPPLTMTGICNSEEHAWRELDRMLDVWARQVQSGQPMTKAQSLEIFGGPNGRNILVLEKFIDEAKKREINL